MFLIIFITFSFIFIINSTIFIGQTLVNKDNKTNKTTTFFIHDNIAFQINKLLVSLFGIFIPYFLVLFLNIIVVLRLRRPKRRVTTEEEANRNIINEFTVSTITLDLVFLIFKAPEIFIKFLKVCFSIEMTNLEYSFAVIMDIFTKFSNSYSDLLVFIFFFFEVNFRKEIIKIFRCFFTKLARCSSF